METKDTLEKLLSQCIERMPNRNFEVHLMARYFRHQERRVQKRSLGLSAVFLLIFIVFGFYITFHFSQLNQSLPHFGGYYSKAAFMFCFLAALILQVDNWLDTHQRYRRIYKGFS